MPSSGKQRTAPGEGRQGITGEREATGFMGWDNPPIPWRELERRLSWRDPRHEAPPPEDRPGKPRPDPQPSPPPPPSPENNGPEWAELHCHSSYSFLDGASSPADLVAEAAERGLAALALTDHDGMYGVPQFAQA